MENSQIFAPVSSYSGAFIGSCMIQMPTSELLYMVEFAASQLLLYFNPASPQYVAPDAQCGNAFDAQAQTLNEIMDLKMNLRASWGQLQYLGVWSQVDLVNHAVTLMNSRPEMAFVGEQDHTRQLIYSALRAAHNWKVRCVELSHHQHGPSFGSVTGWHRISIIKPVEHWPEAYPQHVQAGLIYLLPCDRTDRDSN